MQILFPIYSYLADLNSMHLSLKVSEPDSSAEAHVFNTVDALHSFRDKLSLWQVSSYPWQVTATLKPVVSCACNAGAQMAHMVWCFFASLKWRHPDAPTTPGDFGITWIELAVHFTMFSRPCPR